MKSVGRRKAREVAMQALFAMDITKESDSDEMIKEFLHSFIFSEMPEYFFTLVKGVSESFGRLNAIITKFSLNWKLNRISCVDRNILRIALFEMLFCSDIPNKVAINEAIEIAKKYSTNESGAFINGILDSINKSIENDKISAADLVK